MVPVFKLLKTLFFKIGRLKEVKVQRTDSMYVVSEPMTPILETIHSTEIITEIKGSIYGYSFFLQVSMATFQHNVKT